MPPELANNPAEANANPELANNDADLIETEEVETEAADGQTETDDTEELEHEGQTARVPKWVKAGWMMQSDYTRKTQEAAELRKSLDDGKRQFGEQVASFHAVRKLSGRVDALAEALEQYEKVDWQTLYASNPQQYELTKIQRDQLRDAHAKASRELSEKVTKAQQDAAADTAKRRSELATSLTRDIPGYTPQTADKMRDFGVREFGFTAEEIGATLDPRLHRLLHRAMLGTEAIAKAAKAAAAAKTAQVANDAKPSAPIGNKAPAQRWSPTSKAAQQQSTDEWMRRRNEQVRKQAKS